MPWLLNASANPGDLDSGTYAEIDMREFYHSKSRERIIGELAYGNTVNGVWVSGVAPPEGKETTFIIEGADYDTLIANAKSIVVFSDPLSSGYIHVPAAGGDPEYWVERGYIMVKRETYLWLEANNIIAPGSVA